MGPHSPVLNALAVLLPFCGTTLIMRQCDIESSWISSPEAALLDRAAVPSNHGKIPTESATTGHPLRSPL